MAYEVKLEVFEGPFDLLLSLISKHKLDIYEIPIGQIAEEYLAYLGRMEELDLDVASEFLLLAATLLDIKAAGLIPRDEAIDREAELSAYEKRELLIARLIEYKKFKNAGIYLKSRMQAEENFYSRIAALEPHFDNLLPDFLEGVTTDHLVLSFERLLRRQSLRLIDSDHIATIPISVESKIDEVIELLLLEPQLSFRTLTAAAVGRDEIVATFLALLELYKRGMILINQAATFGDIEISGLGL